MHLHEWHLLLLEWIKNREDGSNKPFLMEALNAFSNEELFTNTYCPWVGGSCIGSYFISTTSSHYVWAMKKIKAHKKICR